MLNVFNYPIQYTHMPHIIEWQDKELLFLSVYDDINQNWKPCYTDWNDEEDPVHFIDLNHKSICNLFCYKSSDNLHFSYISMDSDNNFQLYCTETVDLKTFSPSKKISLSTCWTGYCKDDQIVTAQINELTILQKSEIKKYSFPIFETIFRVFPYNDEILITAIIEDIFHTYIFDYNSDKPILKEIQTKDNKQIYKSTIYKNYLVVAERGSADKPETLYDRKLIYYENFDIILRPNIIINTIN